MDTAQTYVSTRRIRAEMPDEYRKHARRDVREQDGRNLLDLLEQQKLPAVVDFNERVFQTSPEYGYEPDEIFQIEITFTPVECRRVEVPAFLTDIPVSWKRMSFLDRVKWLFSGRV